MLCFFVKHKTTYEMRISDWSSDVCSSDLATGEDLQARINPEDVPRRRRALADHFAGTSAFDCEFRLRTRQGEFQWLHDRGAVEFSPAGTPARMSGIIRLVTLRKQQEERLEYLANFDDLTGHFHKVRLRESLEPALTQSQRFGQTGVYMVIGVDHLDRVNTGYGYEVGNAVLVELGRRLDSALRSEERRVGKECVSTG